MMSHVISVRLATLRRTTGKTWAQVAADLDLSVAMLMMVRGGKRNLSDKALYRLEQAEQNAGVTPPPANAVEPVPKEKAATHIERVIEGHFPTFAGRLKWLREDRLKMPLREFAASVNASKTYIYNLESGKRDNPSANLLEAICSKYELRMDWLKNGFGLPQHSNATLVGPNWEDIPLSGKDAPLTWLRIGRDPLGTMRLMVAHMDNHELIDKAFRVLDADDIPQEEKITVARLYVGAVRERLLPDAPEPEQIEANTARAAMKIRRASIAKEEAESALAQARAEAAAARAEAEEAKAELAELESQVKEDQALEEEYHAAVGDLVKDLKKGPKLVIKGESEDSQQHPHADAA